MNIFVTNTDPEIAAYEHCKVHTVKMILELAQMMSTAHYVLDGTTGLYKPTHTNHPCSIWVRTSRSNYQWAYKQFKALCEVYSAHSGRVHATEEKMASALSHTPTATPDIGLTQWAMAMPDEYKSDDVALSYQNYLTAKYNEWQSREKPIRVEWALGTPDWYK